MEKIDCDICIIGAGPAGYSGAIRAAREGRKVVLVEKDRAGGTCLNRGCIPTKALRHCADVLAEVRESSKFGVTVSSYEFDYSSAHAFKKEVTEKLVGGVEKLLKTWKVETIKGEGALLKPGVVKVTAGGKTVDINSSHVVVATGSVPSELPGIEFDGRRVVSSEGALVWEDLPSSLIVLGAGVIGCEFADVMATFGVSVEVVEALDRILMTEDKMTARTVKKSLELKGVKFHLSSTVDGIDKDDDGVKCTISDGSVISAERMIVSVGRRPEVSSVAGSGAEVSEGRVLVDSGGRTSLVNVWAAGDVTGPPLLAHRASHQMEVVIDNILGKKREFDDLIPWSIFTRPEVASVGLLEDRAKQEGIEVEIGRFAYAGSGMALCMGTDEGFAKVVAQKGGGRILGGTFAGLSASDLVAELTLAIKAGVTVDEFIEVIHAHPSLPEITLEAVADVKGLSVHKAGRKR